MWNTLILNPMINTLLLIYSFLGENFGLAVIAFTILVRLITYPLTAQQMKSTQSMQSLQKSKKWQEMQKKYKDDREKLAQEQMKLYKEMGVSPFGSCLPTLIQLPVIFGLYQSISRALAVTPIQLLDLSRNVYPFINAPTLIPLNNRFLWMDLSLAEKDFGLAIAGIGIPILAILVVITTYLQSKLMTPTANPGEQGAQMTQAMNLYMPFFMGYLAYTFSSGLALYFVASNMVGILQYAAMGKLDWRNLLPGRKASS
ncbi:MAG TPA: YidC/Oxa1 family membrane protein insertase [Anaerolineales bacterium]|nr:YidC/Oxa1 family membrane protein insertase [Anaerolineales bacterium]